jgi:large conductance mechanosensitive channel
MDQVKKIADTGAAKAASSLSDEFKKFAFKGNVVDMAVGVIIGAAFGKIVESLVKNIFMPLISFIMPGDQGYAAWKVTVGTKELLYGQFLGEIVNFLIIALVLFLFVVKLLGWLTKSKKQEAAAPPPPPTKEQELLTEIRDLLKNRPAA